MTVLGTATLGGTNSNDAAVGLDGLLYVVNTGDYMAPGSLTIVNPVCAKLPDGSCRGAFAATTSAAGNLYQVFFRSSSPSLTPYVFVFSGSTYALTDSIPVGVGPSSISIRTF